MKEAIRVVVDQNWEKRSRNTMLYLGAPPCPKTTSPKQIEKKIPIYMIKGFLHIKLTKNTGDILPQMTIKTFICNNWVRICLLRIKAFWGLDIICSITFLKRLARTLEDLRNYLVNPFLMGRKSLSSEAPGFCGFFLESFCSQFRPCSDSRNLFVIIY